MPHGLLRRTRRLIDVLQSKNRRGLVFLWGRFGYHTKGSGRINRPSGKCEPNQSGRRLKGRVLPTGREREIMKNSAIWSLGVALAGAFVIESWHDFLYA